MIKSVPDNVDKLIYILLYTAKGETDECNIGNKYTDCYIEKLFS